VERVPQEPFAQVSATPTAALNQVREIMLIWSSAAAEEEEEEEEEVSGAEPEPEDNVEAVEDDG